MRSYQISATTKNSNPLIVIIGETASGKSDLALALAEQFDGEIICADATTVRQKADIGTAKPTAVDQKRARHHLLDVVEPCADFTAAVFKDLATRALNDINSRGKLPIMVGGTGLYVDAVLYDYSFLPAGNRKEREKLEVMSADELLELAKSKRLDTSKIDIHNKRRLIRLLETGGAEPTRKSLRQNTLILGLRTPREALKTRVAVRVDKMLEKGLEGEVRGLSEVYGWDCEALKAIGYREWREYFDGTRDLAATKARIVKSTLDLAKKQRTWFKRSKSIHWINEQSEVAPLIAELLNK